LSPEEGLDGVKSPVAEFFAMTAELFDRVVEEGEEGVFFILGEFVGEDLVDEIAESAGSIVDDVAEFAVIAVNIADDMDTPLGKGELGLQEGDLGHDG
jgi:hypothetical protein